MAAAYGGGLLAAFGFRPDYLTWVQLWLNLPRAGWRQAVAVARGVGTAMSDRSVPLAYFDAVASCPEEAAEMEYESNAERAVARAMARRGAR